ncbi:MAG: hypothetical protein ACON4R_02965 [Akkermansiaceae bacterium]
MSYRPSETITYVNGKKISRTNQVRGDFSNWAVNQGLILGDE